MQGRFAVEYFQTLGSFLRFGRCGVTRVLSTGSILASGTGRLPRIRARLPGLFACILLLRIAIGTSLGDLLKEPPPEANG